MSQINSKFFSLLKDRNPEIIHTIKKEHESLSFQKPISELKIYNQSMLFWAVTFENETLVNYFLSLNEFLKSDFLTPCLLSIYANKSPSILKTLINKIENFSKEEKSSISELLSQKASVNCYRDENIFLVLNFLDENLEPDLKEKFLESSILHNNTPLLKKIFNYSSFNKALNNLFIKNSNLKELISPWFLSYYSQNPEKPPIAEDQLPISSFNVPPSIPSDAANINETTPVVIVRKKRTPINQN